MWETLYSSDYVYLHLTNNDLVQIPYNQTLNAESSITSLAGPPYGSKLVVSDPYSSPVIYAVLDQQIFYYDPIGDTWRLTQDSQGESLWCKDATPFAPPNQEKSILFYGGTCANSQVLYSYNTSTKVTSKMDSSVRPLGFSKAAYANIDCATTVFIGGNTSTNVWVGMNQVAYYQQGWNYRNVNNYQMLDSRSGALLLPIYPASFSLGCGSRADRALVLGGEVDGRLAEPFSAVLEFSDLGWNYQSNASFQAEGGILGAAVLFETLVTIGGVNPQKREHHTHSLHKRSSDYVIQLYNVNDLEPVQKYVPSQAPLSPSGTGTSTSETAPPSQTSIAPPSQTSSSSSMSKGGIAALSTILPLAAIILVAAFFWYKRRKSQDVQLPRRLDYFDDFVARDRSEMAETNSLNSWTEKRRLWEQSDLNRNSILSQTDILSLPSPPRPVRQSSIRSSSSIESEDGSVNDVQVLVSSRRRTQLRVVNADEDLIDLTKEQG